MPLTIRPDAYFHDAQSKDKPYKLSDGAGMYLLVNPNGSKYWRLAYRHGGKQKTLALGVFPATSLTEARQKRDAARVSIHAGIDPSDERKKVKKGNLQRLQSLSQAPGSST